MKKLSSILTLLIWSSLALGQAKVFQEKLFAPGLRDTISYKVYLPQDWDGWDESQLHPAIYAVNYGMVNGDFVAAQIAYFRKARYEMPNNLLVVIDAGMERMGYQYETGDITEEGQYFVTFIKDQLIPAVTRKYHTSPFRAYLGHSFAASFGSYLMRSEPGLFNGYILLAPEKLGKEKPFQLSDQALKAYNSQYTFIYSGVGEGDMQRRKDFAQEIGKEMAKVDKEYMFFRYDSIPMADHTNILSISMEFALKNIYRFYTPFSSNEKANTFTDLQETIARMKRYYGLELEQTFTFYRPFATKAVKNKDTASLHKILTYFNGPSLKGWNLMQFGEFCLNLDMKVLAKDYFQLAIKKILDEEMNISIGPPNLLVCYQYLALDIYSDKPEKAWEYLLKAKDLEQRSSPFITNEGSGLLNIGKYAAQRGYRLEEGLKNLESYRKGDYKFTYRADYYQAIICQRRGKIELAKKYTQQGLKEKPEDSDLLHLANELGLRIKSKSIR